MRRAGRATAGFLGTVLVAVGLIAASGTGAAGDGDGDRDSAARAAKAGDGTGGFRARKVGDFDTPVFVTGTASKLFVVEQRGVIKVLGRGGRGKRRTFLDITGKVEDGGERGLLSMALDPRFRRNGLFYVYYTRNGGDIVVEEYRRAGKGKKRAARARSRSGRRVLVVEHSEHSNHNGGQIQFGPQGLLYIGTGDGGASYDPPENAQSRNSLLGKMLRIDPHRKGKRRYTIPRSNPYAGKGKSGRKEIFSLGLRNPFRFSFDRRTKHIVIGDVGQDQWEEVDYESVKTARGANFGWDALEGTHRVGADASPVPKNAVPPIFEYSHAGGNCSITGGYVSRDRRIRSLWGRYLYADFCAGVIRSLIPAMNGARDDKPTGLPQTGNISSFGEDARGRLYWATLNGEVFAIEPKRKKKG